LRSAEKAWLDRVSQQQQVSMAELVRRAVAAYRKQLERSGPRDLAGLLDATQGLWKAQDGLDYQQSIRSEWVDP